MITPVFILLFPLSMAALAAVRPANRGHALWAAPLPALLYSIFGDPSGGGAGTWLLMQSHLGLVHTWPAFLFFTSLLWFIAGWFAFSGRAGQMFSIRFHLFWLFTLSGNLGVILAGDAITFYTCFSLMTFAAYGLVVETETRQAWQAGKVYIIMTVVSEVLLLSGFLLACAEADSWLIADVAANVARSPAKDLIVGLLLAGFGIKAGMIPLHFWLPLAHPVAPPPASAVLSGAMIKTGLLGCIQFLPGGHGEWHNWGAFLALAGLATAFFGVIRGLPDTAPKRVLAYSSISQMGVMLFGLGLGLAVPEEWPVITAIVILYAANHGMAKGSLFIGVAVCGNARSMGALKRRWIMAGLALPALAIAGAPFLGGQLAKESMKIAVAMGPYGWIPWLNGALAVSAFGTVLLLGRFWILMFRQTAAESMEEGQATSHAGGVPWAWVGSLGAVLLAAHGIRNWFSLDLPPLDWKIFGAVWPLVAGALAFLAWNFLIGKKTVSSPPCLSPKIPGLLDRAGTRARKALKLFPILPKRRIDVLMAADEIAQSPRLHGFFGKTEAYLRQREVTGLLFLLLFVLLWLLML